MAVPRSILAAVLVTAYPMLALADRPAGVTVGVVAYDEARAEAWRVGDDAGRVFSRVSAAQVCALDRQSPARGLLLEHPGGEEQGCWLVGLPAVARAAGAEGGATYLVGGGADRGTGAAAFAFLMKQASIAIRAADPAATVVLGPLVGDSDDWLEQLAVRDLAPYLDGLATAPESVPALLAARERLLPGVLVWSVEPESTGPHPAAVLRAARALGGGAEAVLVAPYDDEAARAVLGLAAALPVGASPSRAPTAVARSGPQPVLELLGGPDGTERLLVVPPHERALTLRVGVPAAERAEVWLPGRTIPEPLALQARSDGSTGLRLPPAAVPTLVTIHPRSDLITERLEVARERGLTASEIVAREREARARQRLALESFLADARVAYHFTVTNLGESIDVVTENDAFGLGEAVEYRQRAIFVNGHRWKGKPPSFPFIAPEKVKEVPLDVALEEGYHYELEGVDTEAGRDAYRISFAPGPGQSGAFRGTVWIDKTEFFRLRMDLVRLAPSTPVTSDVLTQRFEPIRTDHGVFWLLRSLEGEMLFSALGRNAVLERKVQFDGFRVNPPSFEEERRAAMASSDPMYRDSLEEGLVTLVPGAGGERATRSATTKSNTLVVGGWNGSFEKGLGSPFAAINWFDLDFRGSGKQLDLAFAGLFAALAVTWPDLGAGWDATLEARALGINQRDRYADVNGRVYDATGRAIEDVERLDELVRGIFRRRMGPYFTLSITPSLGWMKIDTCDNDTSPEFLLPPSTLVPGLGLRLELQRKGFQLGLWSEAEHREDWGPYGLPDDVPARTDVRDTPVRYGIQFNKNLYTRRMDRVAFDLDLWHGKDLDRFSSFTPREVEGVRIRGYGGTGLRFTRGATAQIQYSFRVGGNVRLELTLSGASFRSPDDFGPDWQYAYGSTLGVTFPGAKGTLFRIRMNYGIDASLPFDASRDSVRMTVIKTFDGWWPNRKGKRAE